MNAAISRRDTGVVLAAARAASTIGKEVAAADIAATAVDLYARMTARDLAGVLRYIPAAGFTEIGPSAPSVHILKPAAFEALFNSDAVIKLRAEDVNVQRLGSTAVVTGVRVSSWARRTSRLLSFGRRSRWFGPATTVAGGCDTSICLN